MLTKKPATSKSLLIMIITYWWVQEKCVPSIVNPSSHYYLIICSLIFVPLKTKYIQSESNVIQIKIYFKNVGGFNYCRELARKNEQQDWDLSFMQVLCPIHHTTAGVLKGFLILMWQRHWWSTETQTNI